ncbi:hypothetical protein MBLL_00368 (plasmid) [Methylobacterium bullatum]|uniref:Uncharacterized protein n=2 Tax=Methylobacterium bullatum TaxID=570505 RepID=A0A679JP27_9HYPH|nr:hypothetical protein MBLL_00368 [Methylobacterium bullatum]
MSFTLHARARSWFGIQDQRAFARSLDPATREIAPRVLMFDVYYCCLLLGLDGERYGRAEDLEAEEFTKVYPEAYRGQAEIIAGLLVDAELRRQEIQPEDRDSIEAEMVRLLDLKSSTRLSAEGDRLLNLYAAIGFEKLDGAIPSPDNLEDFLVAYHRIWNANV